MNPGLVARTIQPAAPVGSVMQVPTLIRPDKVGAVLQAPGVSPVPAPVVAVPPATQPVYVAGLPEGAGMSGVGGMMPGPADVMPALSPPVIALPSAAAVTDPNLPVPGMSGIGWIRDSRQLKDVDPTTSDIPGFVTPGAPVSIGGGLAEPNAPTTAENPARFDESIEDRHARMFRRLPDIGGAAPWQGVNTLFPNGRVGGVPSHPAPVLDKVPTVSPALTAKSGTDSSRSTPKDLRSAVAAVRRGQKREWNIVPGIGGLDVAMGVRKIPDTPNGVREAIPDKRTLQLFGSQALQSATPASVVEDLAITRKATPTGAVASVPMSAEVTTLSPAQTMAVTPSGKGTTGNLLPLFAIAVAALLFMRR